MCTRHLVDFIAKLRQATLNKNQTNLTWSVTDTLTEMNELMIEQTDKLTDTQTRNHYTSQLPFNNYFVLIQFVLTVICTISTYWRTDGQMNQKSSYFSTTVKQSFSVHLILYTVEVLLFVSTVMHHLNIKLNNICVCIL